MTTYSLEELSHRIGAELKGDPTCIIHGVAPLDKAKSGQISFLQDPKYEKFLSGTSASAVILAPSKGAAGVSNLLLMDNPYLGYAKAAELFAPRRSMPKGIHPSAIIGENCQISPEASIGPHTVLGNNVKVEKLTVIHSGCVIGDDTEIGSNCILYGNVTVYFNVKIRNRVILHGGCVIGSDGFGMANDKGVWHKIPQLGGVVIHDDVEVGANTTVDRGALENTVIETGVKLDNLIQVAHNVKIGAHTAIAACVAIGGGTEIGKHCMIGGCASINGHIKIVDNVILTATAEVSSSILEPGIYSSGMPAQPNRIWRKNAVRFSQLDEFIRRLIKLEGRVL